MDTKKLIGDRISKALSLRDMKQKDLAEKLGITANTVSYFCSGARIPNIEQMIKISDCLKVTTDYLLGKTEDPEIRPAATDELGLSKEAVSWIKNLLWSSRWTDTQKEISGLFEKGFFQEICMSLIEYKHALRAEGIVGYLIACCTPDDNELNYEKLKQTIQKAALSGKYPSHTNWFLNANSMWFDKENEFLDIFEDTVDGFSFSLAWRQKAVSTLDRLFEAIESDIVDEQVNSLHNIVIGEKSYESVEEAIMDEMS